MPRVFARTKSPFNFMGHMSEAQKLGFYSWLKARKDNFTAIKEFHQIRAQQLRKTAGLLEAFYKPESLEPTFVKEPWSPSHHFTYSCNDDIDPAKVVNYIKTRYKEQLQYDDEATFHMNWLRVQIERQEDLAQVASEAPMMIPKFQEQLDTMFNQPRYDSVLVLNSNADKFRTNQMDEPTPAERLANPIQKDVTV